MLDSTARVVVPIVPMYSVVFDVLNGTICDCHAAAFKSLCGCGVMPVMLVTPSVYAYVVSHPPIAYSLYEP